VNVLLLQMELAEDVEDLGGLTGAPPEATEVNLVLTSDAGEGSSAVPVLTVAGEDPVSAPTPTVEDAPKVVAEPTVEDPTVAVVPSHVAK
jgi:hypothetical protein